MIDLKRNFFPTKICVGISQILKVTTGYIALLVIIVLPNALNAQNEDIDRDLKVMEAILNEIVKSEIDGDHWGFSDKLGGTKASYIEGYGILVKIPDMSNSIFAGDRVIRIVTEDDGNDENVVINGLGQNINVVTNGKVKEHKDGELIEKIEKVMRTFLVSYGDIVRDLPEDEKIIMLYKKKNRGDFFLWDGKQGLNIDTNKDDEKPVSQFSVEVQKSDINLLKDGKLTEEEFWMDKVKKKRIQGENDKKEQLEYNVLGKIFESRLSSIKPLPTVDDDHDDQIIFMSLDDFNKVEYEVVSGIGIVYNLYINMPFSFSSTSFKIKAKDIKKLEKLAEDSEEWSGDRDEFLENILDNLGESIKEDMIAYGRTLRSLPADELLIVELHLPKCFDCDLAGTYQLSVNKAVLDAYDKREIDLEEAMDKITVKEKGKARDRSDYHSFFYNWRE